MTAFYAWGGPVGKGLIRSRPEDFEVDEQLGHTPSGEGEHLWLWVEKRGLNTVDVGRALAEKASIHPRAVGFAGLKDRNALTRQYFSLHLPGRSDPDWSSWSSPQLRIIAGERSDRKIQRGRLQGNRFSLTVRALDADPNCIDQRLERLKRHGAPNGFGEQRFGGNNVARARALFAGGLKRQPSRPKRGFYLSAARSLLFNQVLETRIEDQSWNQVMPGDVVQLEGSRSIFVADPSDPTLAERCARLDIHPTGPLAGKGAGQVFGGIAELEDRILSREPDLVTGLERFGLRSERRALRMVIQDLEWSWPDPDTLKLSFGLGQGSYATSVLREIISYDIPT